MILPKWLLLTRLETRTKESTPYASVKVEKPKRVPKGMQDVKRKPQHQPILSSLKLDLSKSKIGRTRKMVNYG